MIDRMELSKQFIHCGNCGTKITLPEVDEILKLPSEEKIVIDKEKIVIDKEKIVIDKEKTHTQRRTIFEEVMVYVKRIVDGRSR